MAFDPAEIDEMFADLEDRGYSAREVFGYRGENKNSGYGFMQRAAPRSPVRSIAQQRDDVSQAARVTDPCRSFYRAACIDRGDESTPVMTSCGGRIEVGTCSCGRWRFQAVAADGYRSKLFTGLGAASTWIRRREGGVIIPNRPRGTSKGDWARRLLYDCQSLHRKLEAYAAEARRLYREVVGDDAPPCAMPTTPKPQHVSTRGDARIVRKSTGPAVIRRRAT